MSMALYTLGLHPLLKVLEQKLPGLRMGNQERHTSVIAYADDVTIFVTSIADFPIIEEAIRLFERSLGARLNPRKSKSIAVGDGAQGKSYSGMITTHMPRYSV